VTVRRLLRHVKKLGLPVETHDEDHEQDKHESQHDRERAQLEAPRAPERLSDSRLERFWRGNTPN
jgi:hypothetical protein